MLRLPPFRYHRPTDLAEALGLGDGAEEEQDDIDIDDLGLSNSIVVIEPDEKEEDPEMLVDEAPPTRPYQQIKIDVLDPTGAGLAVEIIILGVLITVILGSIAFFAFDSRRERGAVDKGEVVALVSERIDQGPRELFHEGTILLLRCSWLLDHPNEKVTGTRRQEMPAEAYFPPDEAADLFGKGDTASARRRAACAWTRSRCCGTAAAPRCRARRRREFI